MLTITHTFTAEDFDLIGEHESQRIATKYKTTARWPFRIAQIIAGIAFVITGITLIQDKKTPGFIILFFGVFVICGSLILPLFSLFFPKIIRRISKKKIGSRVSWEIDDTGIRFVGTHYAWSAFRSFSDNKAGLLLTGPELMWIPVGALSDPTTRICLHEILRRHVKQTD